MSIDSDTDPTYRGAGAEPALAWFARRPGPWFALIWLPVLIVGPLVDAVAGGNALRVAALVVLGAVFACTVWLPYRRTGERAANRRFAELSFTLFLLLGAGYFVGWQTDRQFLFPLLAIAAAVAIRRGWAFGIIWGLAVSGASAVGFEQSSLDAAMLLGFATFFGGAANLLVRYLVDLVAELRRTQHRLAHVAVGEERLRFSRDLHDLLGHTLSVIVVKAEAVRRLLASDPEAAAAHSRDIETIGREALAEVREAVSGYRSVGLADEIERARGALAADGIRLELSMPEGEGVPPGADSLLGWVVREATTNILRHAEATRCRITLTQEPSSARIEIVDNGRGGRTGYSGGSAAGSGLQGLAERIGDAGGELGTTATAQGFRLTASIPLTSDGSPEGSRP
ncbi:sensor histidine kinase [Microbacterium sp. STN6]|uniref:sensor histidine kinase n=1 Tax=Microbacterium sp. STN6 TaxID=2995588 RepID=UPI0022608D19|nr:sensor histidine kinase [Microbacterium sp. STN6]MCX7522721.1 sensor histidine kinase [Microbacterium sp. STN6]